MDGAPGHALVVYEETGAGHEVVARLIGGFLTGAGWRVTVTTGAALSGDPTHALVVATWNTLVGRGWFSLADLLVNRIGREVFLPVATVTNAARGPRVLAPLAPDLIVSTCDGVNKGLGSFAAARNIPFIVFLTDLRPFRDLLHPAALHVCYLPETAAAVRSFGLDHAWFRDEVKPDGGVGGKLRYVLRAWRDSWARAADSPLYRALSDIPAAQNEVRCAVFGPLRPEPHHHPPDRAAAREALGIPAAARVVVAVSGSLGGAYLERTVRALADGLGEGQPGDAPTLVLALPGRDAALHRRLGALRPRGAVEVRSVGHLADLAGVFAAADLLVARPSAGVFLEALLATLPMLLPTETTVNDVGALELLALHGLGETYTGPGEMVRAATRILSDPSPCRERIAAFRGRIPTWEEQRARFLDLVAEERRRAKPAHG